MPSWLFPIWETKNKEKKLLKQKIITSNVGHCRCPLEDVISRFNKMFSRQEFCIIFEDFLLNESGHSNNILRQRFSSCGARDPLQINNKNNIFSLLYVNSHKSDGKPYWLFSLWHKKMVEKPWTLLYITCHQWIPR